MKTPFTISVFTENHIGLLNRVSIIFTRRHINVESLVCSSSEIDGIHRFTIVIEETEEQVKKIVKQLEKQVEVVKAFYHDDSNIVHQELALYKIPTSTLTSGGKVEALVRKHNARLLSVDPEFTTIEKTGHRHENSELFHELKSYGILEFINSGRVVITKPMKELKSYIKEVETASVNN